MSSIFTLAVKAQDRVPLLQFAKTLQGRKAVAGIEPLVMLGHDHRIRRKQGGLREQLEDLRVDLLHAVGRIEKDEVGNDVLCFQAAQGAG